MIEAVEEEHAVRQVGKPVVQSLMSKTALCVITCRFGFLLGGYVTHEEADGPCSQTGDRRKSGLEEAGARLNIQVVLQETGRPVSSTRRTARVTRRPRSSPSAWRTVRPSNSSGRRYQQGLAGGPER